MRKLQLWDDYTREDVHAIFSPDTKFTPQAGTWGLQGMVRIPDRQGDWVFFVTFGKTQGDHVFDEAITEDGVLSWQSQPAQQLKDDAIQELIRHDERVNNIHLFLRTTNRSAYSYLGRLGYITHDANRERPVYFQWQILDWPAPPELGERIELKLLPSATASARQTSTAPINELTVVDAPAGRAPRQGVTTQEFKARKAPDYAARDERNRQLGLKGEELVVEYEKGRLRSAGRADLAEFVVHVSVIEGDAAGYDIRSFELDGRVRHIEVKTTQGDAKTAFYLSANEVAFSAENAETYFLYRLFDFDLPKNSAKTFVVRGAVSEALNLIATAYRAELMSATAQ